jgi:ParB-like chromosome segregation protein Spo0J
MPELSETPLAASVAAILQGIQSDPQINLIAAISGGRYLIDVPVKRLETHEEIKKIRHKSPEQVDLLRESIKKTGGTPIYTPCVYVEIDRQQHLHFYIADGSQRLRSLLELGQERTVVLWIDRWLTVKDAMDDALSLQFARYEMNDDDVISILETGRFTVKEVAERSGKSESTTLRFKKVAENPWVKPLIKDDVFGYAQFAKLIDASGGNLEKLNALRNTLLTRYDEAVRSAAHWKNKIEANSKKKWDKRSKEKSHVAHYFKKITWGDWENQLKSKDAVVIQGNKPMLNLENDGSGTMAGVWIGDSSDWEEEVAVYGFFGKKAKDILPEDFDEVLDNWDTIRQRIETHRNRVKESKAKANNPMPTNNPVESEPSPERPQRQEPQMKVVPSIDDTK